MRLKEILNVSKAEITFLVLVVAVTGFLSAPGASGRIATLFPLLLSGALASMSAGIFNNIYDMDIDARMRRTSSRKFYLDSKGSRRFFAYATVMLATSIVVGLYFVNPLATAFILLGFASYVFLYTVFLKRRTSWNIVIGGIAGSFPALAGWAAVSDGVSLTALYIAMLVFIWTPTHFWSLAMGLREDYSSAGVPMLPSVVSEGRASGYVLANTALLVGYTLLPLFLPQISVGLLYLPAAIIMDTFMIFLVLKAHLRLPDRKWFREAFHFSNLYLLVILVSVWWIVA